MDRYKIILNPVAGKGNAAGQIPVIEAFLKKYNVDYEIELTKDIWHAAEIAKAASKSDYSVVVAAGGDGTGNEVLNGLMQAKADGLKIPALGLLSIGRGNDFAYGAGIPSDLEEQCRILAKDGIRYLMDTGKVTGGDYPEGRYFGNGIGIGFDTIVGLEAAKMKHVHGFLAYVAGALKTMIIYPEAPEVNIEFNGKVINQAASQISIMNGRRMGGTFFMAPDGCNTDGLLDLCMSQGLKRSQMVKLILMYTKGTQASSSLIKTGRADKYIITAETGGLIVHADGETICTKGKSLTVECFKKQIEMISDPELRRE